MSYLDLHQQARAAIQSGKLPSRVPDRTWGGPGVGAACPICGLPVSRQEMEFEMEFARDKFLSISNATRPGSSSGKPSKTLPGDFLGTGWLVALCDRIE